MLGDKAALTSHSSSSFTNISIASNACSAAGEDLCKKKEERSLLPRFKSWLKSKLKKLRHGTAKFSQDHGGAKDDKHTGCSKDEYEHTPEQAYKLHKAASSTSLLNLACALPDLPSLKFDRQLGSGSFSRVMLADLDGEKVAVKVFSVEALKANARLLEAIEGEVQIYQTIRHPHIPEFKKLVKTGSGQIGMVLEWCPYGELFSYVSAKRRLQEAEVRVIVSQLVSAVLYLHSRKIVHRDLKLENILISSHTPLTIKLIDFGLARHGATALHTRCGSEEYAAPEIIRGLPYDGQLSDAWSIGVVMYACAVGSLPFQSDPSRPAVLYDRICNALFRIPDESPDCDRADAFRMSLEARKVLRSLLTVRAQDRMTLAELSRHPWLALAGAI